MKTVLQIKLLPDAAQYAALKDTMRVFNEACNCIAEVAFREQCASKFVLQKHMYEHVRKQFGLSAQLTIRAIAKVVVQSEAGRRCRSVC